MTLVIAGHALQKSFFDEESTSCQGLFAVSDSAITEGERVLARGFKKVIETPIRVKVNDGVSGYRYCMSQSTCFMAFAGGTLVAQHVLNSIENHLSELYLTYEEEGPRVVMPCESSRHLRNFRNDGNPTDLERYPYSILSANQLSDVVKHSIQAAMDKSREYDGMRDVFSSARPEFIFGVRCPANKSFHIYRYERVDSQSASFLFEKQEILQGKVAVIGLRKIHEREANSDFESAIRSGRDTAEAMHLFVARAIKSQNDIGVFSVCKPCNLYLYDGGHLRKESRIK